MFITIEKRAYTPHRLMQKKRQPLAEKASARLTKLLIVQFDYSRMKSLAN